jgi:hypothetical protein
VKKLDRDRGFESFILGDSLYPKYFASHKRRSDSYDVVEVSVLDNVISIFNNINPPQRFVYNSEVRSLNARSINGKIFWYQVFFDGIDSLSYSEIRDSLTSKYGTPNSRLDTTISRPGDYKGYRWKGNRVWLQLMSIGADKPVRVWMTITDHDLFKRWINIGQRVYSLAHAKKIDPLKKVGEFPLSSTKEHPMVRAVTEENLLSDGTYKEYKIDYEKYLKPFLGIDNVLLSSTGDKVINTEHNFGLDNDSLRSLKILVENEKYDPNETLKSSTFDGYYDLEDSVAAEVGEASVVIEERTKSEEHKFYHWYGTPFSVEVRHNYITEEKEVVFIRTKPREYRGILSGYYLGEKNFRTSPW